MEGVVYDECTRRNHRLQVLMVSGSCDQYANSTLSDAVLACALYGSTHNHVAGA